MEQDKFITRLQELAEITTTKAPQGPKIRKTTEHELVFRQGQQIPIDPKANQTWGVKIKKIIPIIKSCEDCGLRVEDRMVTKKLYTFPHTHWRTNCENCRKTQNPETGVFDVDTDRSQSVFIGYFNRQDK